MSTSYDFDVVRVQGLEEYGAYEVDDVLKETGWVGGLWVKYKQMTSIPDGNGIRWSRIVEKAGPTDPMVFILRASYEGTDRYTGRYPGKTGVVTCCLYGQFLFKYYETSDLAERTNPGTGSSLTYSLNQRLYVSSNGLLTPEDEAGASSRAVGFCCGTPSDNNNYVGCEVLIGP